MNFSYIAIQSDSRDDGVALECAGFGETAEEAIADVYCEDDDGDPDPNAIIDIFKYEGSFRKKVEVTVEKVEGKKKARE